MGGKSVGRPLRDEHLFRPCRKFEQTEVLRFQVEKVALQFLSMYPVFVVV
jgi:hypothetical protein